MSQNCRKIITFFGIMKLILYFSHNSITKILLCLVISKLVSFSYTRFLSDKKILFFLIIKRMRKWSRERMISLIHVMHEAILKVITSNSSHLLVCWTSSEPMATRIWQRKMKKKTYLSHCFKSNWQYKAWLISIYNSNKLI